MSKTIDVLLHASSNGRYVTDDPFVAEMATQGLLRDHGPQVLAGGDHYYTTTPKGRQAINEWKAAQPKPKARRRRQSKAFEGWRLHCELARRIPFNRFLKEVWPRMQRGSWP